MPHAAVNGIELYYETMGDPAAEPLLLVMGLGAQLVAWDEEFCEGLVERGFHVVRFDNRDVGLSTKLDVGGDPTEALGAALGGGDTEAPYLIADMAADAAALLDHLEVEAAHIVGASMGGMIVQQMVIDHPHKVRTMTSIMSTTGDADVGQPTAEALTALVSVMTTPVVDREGAVAASIVATEVIGSPGKVDPDQVRRRAEISYDRDPDGSGMLRQLLAILSSPSRSEGLGTTTVPVLVIHGDQDPLVQPSGGERTAQVTPGSEYLVIEGMGHDSPREYWPLFYEAIEKHARRA